MYFIKGKLTKVISKVHVHDDVYELLGEISDSDDSDSLETYLLSEYHIKNACCDSQDEMARTKQTAKKTDPKTGQMPPPAPPGTDESSSELPETPGGFPLARFPRKAKSSSPARSPRRKSPASSPSGGRGSKRPVSSSPARSSPRKKAKTAASTGFTSSESDFFSMDNDDEDDNEVTLNLKVPAEPSQKNLANPDDPAPVPQPHPSKQPRRPIPSKNMRKVAQQHNMARARRGGRSTFQQVAFWNRTGRMGQENESERGYMERAKKQHDDQGRLLRRNRPGTVALREIRFYQKSRVLLIPIRAFQRWAREVAMDVGHIQVRWQQVALYNLQVAAEAYIVGFLSDTNICAIHRKLVTIYPKDMIVAKRLRCHTNVGMAYNMADQQQAYV